MTRFDLEKYWVTRFLELVAIGPCELRNPKDVYNDETGADVLLELDDRKIGIPVTELDAGADNPFGGAGKLRADEKRRVAQAARDGHSNAYGGSAPATPNLAIRAVIQKKSVKRLDTSKFDEGWLLISANLNEWGSLDSTFVAPSLIDVNFLRIHTADLLKAIHFDRMFFHMIVGKTLYEWQPTIGWRLLYKENIPGPNDPGVQELRKEALRATKGGRNSLIHRAKFLIFAQGAATALG